MALLRRTRVSPPEPVGRVAVWPPAAGLGWRGPRPGGPEMTELVLEGAGFGPEDRVVEIYPGFGETARRIARQRPRSYTGVCRTAAAADVFGDSLRRDPDVLTLVTRQEASGHYAGAVAGSADATGLADESANVVIGEFLLTPMTTRDKAAAMAEAARLLPAGGRVALHEICVAPEAGETDADLASELAGNDRGAIYPLTDPDWRSIAEGAGLLVLGATTGPLVPPRPIDVISSIGLRNLPGAIRRALPGLGSLGIARGLAYSMETYPQLRAIVLIAEKPLLGDVRVRSEKR